jgi:septal ring factor EnvC (AmiA/AmiB activator)
MPVRGTTLVKYGDKQPHGGPSEGQWIRTRKNAQVVSPADGWIVFAGEFRSYGQLLIIDAGGGYHVLLAGMKRIDVDVGQFVLASEPVAVMASPASKDGQPAEESRPALYIEFRKDGRPVDPAPWWAKTPEKVQG